MIGLPSAADTSRARIDMAAVIPISDPDDERTALYRNIRERDLVGRKGLFVAEGEVVLRILLRQTRHEVVSLFIAEKRVAGLMPLIETLPGRVPVFAATQTAMDAIAGFPLHRGILAIGRRADGPTPQELIAAAGGATLLLVLFGIANHDNMGGIFRNAAAFGVDGVILGSDCCDPLYRKALRVAVGAPLIVPFARLGRNADPLALLEEGGVTPLALSPGGRLVLNDLRRPARAAVLLGAEGPGLPAAILERATSVRIPMAAGFDSLNVATTSGIILHHLRSGGP